MRAHCPTPRPYLTPQSQSFQQTGCWHGKGARLVGMVEEGAEPTLGGGFWQGKHRGGCGGTAQPLKGILKEGALADPELRVQGYLAHKKHPPPRTLQ